MYLIFLVLIASLQLSQTQDPSTEEVDQIPHNVKESEDPSVNLRERRGRSYSDRNYDDDEEYDDRNVPYHERVMQRETLESRKGPGRTYQREVHILKLDLDPKAVFLYFPFTSNSVQTVSKKK